MHRKDRAREGGFTLIEIILLLILVGIIVTLALPRFVSPRAGAASRKLAADIRYAKELAIRLHTVSAVYFDTPTTYRIIQDDAAGTPAIDPVEGENFEVTMSGHFTGVTLTNDIAGAVLKFNALGTPLEGAANNPLAAVRSITLSFGGETRTVTVQPNTGKVTVS